MLFDAHAHYDDEKFDSVRDELLTGMKALGVSKIVNAGSSLKTSYSSKMLSDKYDFMYFTAGVHPEAAARDMQEKDWLSKIRWLCKNEKCVAIGEIGLDYYYGKDDIDAQKQCFEMQLTLAEELGMPVIVHDRDAHGDCLEMIKKHRSVKGLFHCFSGSAEMAKELLSLGWYISVGGVVTFKNARKTVELISELKKLHPQALSRLLLETDCPYLAPVPHRGELNHSGLMKHTAEKVAELLGISYEEVSQLTYDNAVEFYRIKE